MEFLREVPMEVFYTEPKVIREPKSRFVVVRYGWYSFVFQLAEGESPYSVGVAEEVVRMAEAMLMLKEEDEKDVYLRYSILAARKLLKTK